MPCGSSTVLSAPHQVELGCAAAEAKPGALVATDAMLGGDRAAARGERLVDAAFDAVARRRIRRTGGDDVQVAVAEVAEDEAPVGGPFAFQPPDHFLHVVFHRRDRQADVERDRHAEPENALDIVAQRPHRLALRLRRADDGVGHLSGFQRRADRLLELRLVARRIAARALDQDVVVVGLRQRRRALGRRRRHHAVEVVPHQLERRQTAAEGSVDVLQEPGDVAERWAGHQCALGAARRLAQAQYHARDHPERALGADEKLLQVVGRVVLQHAVHGGDHRAVRQHRLEAEHGIARHAVADHAVAAGVGRDTAADVRRPACAEVHRVEQAVPLGFLLDALQRHAGLDRHRASDRVDLEDPVHALERQGDFVRGRDAALHQPGQAAHHHHRLARRVAGGQHPRYFLRAARPHDRARRARAVVGPAHRARSDLGPGQYVGGPDDVGESFDQHGALL